MPSFLISSKISIAYFYDVNPTKKYIQKEAERLFLHLNKFEYDFSDCEKIAPITLEIEALKKEKNAIILAHSYQTPDIQFGVADKIGDSYGLAKEAQNTNADIILFSSVLFMGETAKILNPEKKVLVPGRAGCSLADSITAEDVRNIRKKYPDAGVVAYVNTSAEVKSEVDACCTSSNAHKIVDAMPQKNIIFLPDNLMGKNLQKRTKKNLILWDGVCIVHEKFNRHELKEVRTEYPKAKILVHPECDPEVVEKSDFVGSTEQMLKHLEKSDSKQFMMVTECGLSDRAQKEYPEKEIVGTCHVCPYMKELTLKNILKALKEPSPNQEIFVDEVVAKKARKSLDMMFELEKKWEKEIK